MAYTSINKPSDYFNTITWTGDGNSTRSLTGVGFQPDFIWQKSRNSSSNHNLVDAVRGIDRRLLSYSTIAEVDSAFFASFDNDGFSLDNANDNDVNLSGNSYVAWNWLASNTTASNTDGSITSTVSANTTSGFSIVSFTGNGTDGATVGHGLGVAPDVVIIKSRDAVRNWPTYHRAMGSTNSFKLNLNDAATTSLNPFNGTDPTSSVVELGVSGGANVNGEDKIMYCFAPIKGFSKFGKFTATSSTNGPFVYTGFKPAFVLVKGQTGTNWLPIDNARDPINPRNNWLRMNTGDAEFSPTNKGTGWDFLSNGFKVRNWNQDFNDTGSDPYIYMAFAENPFVSSTGTPVTAV